MNSELENFPQLAQWFNSGKQINLLGQQIFYRDSGEHTKPTILMIHGFPTSSWDWQPMIELLQNDYRIICLDLLGFGFSAKPKQSHYSVFEQADIIEALIEYLQLNQFHVLAHDYGDTIAQELLARQNNGTGKGKWLSCCLLNGGIFPETHRPLLAQKLLLSPIGPILCKLLGKATLEKSMQQIFGKNSQPSQQQLDEFWQLITLNEGKAVFYRGIYYMKERRENRDRWVAALTHSKIPIALINGSADPISGKHMAQRYQALDTRLDYLFELDEIGHYPQVEAPQQVAQSYTEFLVNQ